MVSAFTGWTAFCLYLGAARADASRWQALQLRREVPPLLDSMKKAKNNEQAQEAMYTILNKCSDIMGSAWRPRGDWDRWIRKLIGEENGTAGADKEARELRYPERKGS